jgi:hypothetical protein
MRSEERRTLLTYAVAVSPTDAGACRVDVTLEGGSDYTTDVTFAQLPATACCAATIAPTQTSAAIDDSASTCAYLGRDAATDAQADADAVPDGEPGDVAAPSDAASDTIDGS